VIPILIRKVEPGRWLLYPHPQHRPGEILFYATGYAALAEVTRLAELWPRCASLDDFLDNRPDVPEETP